MYSGGIEGRGSCTVRIVLCPGLAPLWDQSNGDPESDPGLATEDSFRARARVPCATGAHYARVHVLTRASDARARECTPMALGLGYPSIHSERIEGSSVCTVVG